MAGLFKGHSKTVPEYTGLQVNTAVQVIPIPIVYGCPRCDVNLIYYNGFVAVKKKSGGKGILSGGKGSTSVEYYATVLLAVGEGPLGIPNIIYNDSNVYIPADFPTTFGAYWFDGSAGQDPWSYIAGTWPQDTRAYPDTAYYAIPEGQLDSSATVPQINLVPTGLLAGTSPLNYSVVSVQTGQYGPDGNPYSFIGSITLGCADADPAGVIWDFLTDKRYGVGFPSYLIDSSTIFTQPGGSNPYVGDATLSTYCQAVGLGWSVILNNAESGGSILDRWCRNLCVAIVWNGAVLRFLPYLESPAGGNPGYYAENSFSIPPKYYVPWTTPICVLTMDQILQSKDKTEDPITFTRKDPWEVYNTFRLDFKDRTNFFNSNVSEAKDEALVEIYGPRIDNLGQAEEFSLEQYAQISAQLQLRHAAKTRRTYTWKMGPLWAWLEPMHVISIPNPTDYTKNVLVRVQSVEEDEDEVITIIAEEYNVGSVPPSLVNLSPTTPPNQGATNSPPAPIYVPVMFSMPNQMLSAKGFGTTLQWVFGASGGRDGTLDSMWGGCDVWISLDDANYQLVGTLTGPSTIGKLSSPLSATATSVTVDLNESNGALATWDSVSAGNGAGLCIIQDVSGFELIAYQTATLSGNYTYTLTGVVRGYYGTTARLFGAGSSFMFVGTNANYLDVHLPDAYVGETFYVKGQSFNSFNTAHEDINTCTAYTYTATGGVPASSPSPPPTSAPATTQAVTNPVIP